MQFQVTPNQQRQLETISIASGLPVQDLVQRAIDDFILFHPAYEKAVLEATAEVERGEWLEHEEVVARIEKLLAEKGFARSASA